MILDMLLPLALVFGFCLFAAPFFGEILGGIGSVLGLAGGVSDLLGGNFAGGRKLGGRTNAQMQAILNALSKDVERHRRQYKRLIETTGADRDRLLKQLEKAYRGQEKEVELAGSRNLNAALNQLRRSGLGDTSVATSTRTGIAEDVTDALNALTRMKTAQKMSIWDRYNAMQRALREKRELGTQDLRKYGYGAILGRLPSVSTIAQLSAGDQNAFQAWGSLFNQAAGMDWSKLAGIFK